MEKNINHKSKNYPNKIQNRIASILLPILITGCQTTDTKRNRELAHVINEQQILIDALVAERDQRKIKMLISNSETLIDAEAHLFSALNELKQSSQTLKEVLKNDRH